jgi:hypothetical protein
MIYISLNNKAKRNTSMHTKEQSMNASPVKRNDTTYCNKIN